MVNYFLFLEMTFVHSPLGSNLSIFNLTGTWVHYTVTFKFTSPGTNLQLYINGETHPDTYRWYQSGQAITPGYNGNLELGVNSIGDTSWQTGHIMIDDLIIWEEQLPCDDVYRLYQAYNV